MIWFLQLSSLCTWHIHHFIEEGSSCCLASRQHVQWILMLWWWWGTMKPGNWPHRITTRPARDQLEGGIFCDGIVWFTEICVNSRRRSWFCFQITSRLIGSWQRFYACCGFCKWSGQLIDRHLAHRSVSVDCYEMKTTELNGWRHPRKEYQEWDLRNTCINI